MAVDDRITLAVATEVFHHPTVEDDLDRFFDFAMRLLIAANLFGWLAFVSIVIVTCQDGYC